MKYLLTEAAERDVRGIIHHIRTAQKSPQNARLVAERLRAAFVKLVKSPHLGHPREELNDPDARVLFVSGVLVIYDSTLTPLTVLRVIHASRDLRRIEPRS